MTISGMTGFARADGARAGLTWVWELKSVNGRGLDVRARVPSGMDGVEAKARDAAKKRFTRGSINLSLQVQRETSNSRVRINSEQLAAYIAAAAPFVQLGVAEAPRLDGLLGLRGVIELDDVAEDDDERAATEAAIVESFAAGLDALDAARREEGAALAPVLEDAIARIETLRAAAADHGAAQPEAIRDRLRARLSDLLGGALPDDRLAMEAAALAVKADVREELDRLAAHVVSARELMALTEASGRRLDFLAQEFNREANTLCSKSPDAELTRIGLDLKAVIDQFREQAQNVE